MWMFLFNYIYIIYIFLIFRHNASYRLYRRKLRTLHCPKVEQVAVCWLQQKSLLFPTEKKDTQTTSFEHSQAWNTSRNQFVTEDYKIHKLKFMQLDEIQQLTQIFLSFSWVCRRLVAFRWKKDVVILILHCGKTNPLLPLLWTFGSFGSVQQGFLVHLNPLER